MSQLAFRTAHRPAGRALFGCSALALAAAATPAFAQCTNTTSTTVDCTGTAPSFTNTSANQVVTVESTAAVTAPLIIGNSGTLNNNGSIAGANAAPVVQFGNNATINNLSTGTISSTGAATGAAAISVGDNSTVTNDGTLTATAGYPAVEFGVNGKFVNDAVAPAAVVGDIVFGNNTGNNRASFTNLNTAFGLTGNVTAGGNVNLDNEGLWTGNFTQTALGGTVSFINGQTNNSAATIPANFTGILAIGDEAVVQNYGTMILSPGSVINSYQGGSSTSFTNSGTLTVGSSAAPTQLVIYGNFAQTAGTTANPATLNIAIAPPGALAIAAGSNYSQVYAAMTKTGAGGTASLAGVLNLNVQAGFYATGSTYQVVLADNGITVDPALKVTGNTLPFVTFQSLGVVATPTGTAPNQQAYEFQAQHTSDYAAALRMAGIATTGTRAAGNELTVASGLNPLITLANATPGGAEAAFLGYVDVLTQSATSPQVTAFLDSASPEGYYAYVTALRDQANAFSRVIDKRITDQNSQHDEDGWWLSTQGQFQFNSTGGTYHSKSNLIGISAGYDFSGPHHVLGAALNISWDSLTYGSGSMTGKNRDFAISTYGGWNLGPVHLTGQVAYHFGHLGATKTLDLGAYSFTSAASASEHLIYGTAKAGVPLITHGIVFEPFVGIDAMKGKVNSFTESGTLTAAELTVGSMKADRTELIAGASLTRSHGVFRPYGRVTYRTKLGSSNNANVSAYFDGLSGDAFTVTANPEGKHEIDADAGINWVFDDAGSLFVGYQGTIREKFQSHGINFGIRIEF